MLDKATTCYRNRRPFDNNALGNCSNDFLRNSTLDFRKVSLDDAMRWVCEALAEVAIISKQQKSFGVCIQTPNVKEPSIIILNNVTHTRTTLGIRHGCHHATRLVESNNDVTTGLCNAHIIDVDDVDIRIYSGAKFVDKFTVDCHSTGSDEFFTLAARAKTCCGKNFLKANVTGFHD
jgi:hypothetical protein